MSAGSSPFRNQRTRFQNFSPPYGDKVCFDPERPSEGHPPRGGVTSRKNGRVVSFWTMQEYAAIMLFEATSSIIAYEERPERLRFRDGPSFLFYVPHFCVELERSVVIVELSAKGEPRTSRQVHVAELARAHYAHRGLRYVELSHSVIRDKPRSTNAHILMRYLSTPASGEQDLLVRDVLAAGPAPIAEVEQQSGVSHGRILSMVRDGVITVQGTGPISQASVVACRDGRRS